MKLRKFVSKWIFWFGLVNAFVASILSVQFVFAENLDYRVNIIPSINLTLSANEITLNPNPINAEIDEKNLNIFVSTNNSTGYSLLVNTDNSALVSSTSAATIPALASKVGGYTRSEFTTNAWGYKIGSGNYFPIENNTEIASSTGPISNASTTMTLAAKVDMNQANGSYSTTLNYVALAKYSNIVMQNLSSAFCTTTPMYVEDSRDHAQYLIQRLEDGKCWMLENLGFSDISLVLTSANTDLDTGKTFQFQSDAKTWSDSFTEAKIDDSDKNKVVKKYGIGSGKVGTYYNYCAISVGDFCEDKLYPSSAMTNSICPAGWRLPIGTYVSYVFNSEYDTLYNLYAGTSDQNVAFMNAISGALSGIRYSNGIANQDISGQFVTNYVNITNSYINRWDYYSNALHYLKNQYYNQLNNGMNVRCVLRED